MLDTHLRERCRTPTKPRCEDGWTPPSTSERLQRGAAARCPTRSTTGPSPLFNSRYTPPIFRYSQVPQ